jgi:hypothetical protein
MELRDEQAHEAPLLDYLTAPLVPGGFEQDRPIEPDMPADAEPDYEALVRTAAIAALTVLLAKVAWVLLISNFEGATIGVRFGWGFVPYFAIVTDPITFTTIVTMSTAGMAFAAVVLMVIPTVRPQWTRFRILGLSLGLVLTFETFLLEVFRHFAWSTVVRWDLAWITVFELLIGAGLLILALKVPRYVADTHTSYVPLAAWEHVQEDRQ